MKKETVLILERQDLLRMYQGLGIENVELTHFKGSREPMNTSPIVLFIDDNGYTKILKNRHGDHCDAFFEKKYSYALEGLDKIKNILKEIN